jgi:hypothetical protein
MYHISGTDPKTPGYYKVEAWPGPVTAVVCISYDPACADEDAIKQAITEPYYDMAENRWWLSPFLIEGYTPPGLDGGRDATSASR